MTIATNSPTRPVKTISFRVNKDMPQMDPELQRNLALLQNGQRKTATASTAADEVAVIARVDSYKQWQNLTEVRTPLLIGTTEDGTEIVTGRIPLKRIEFIRSQPWLKSLKAARKLKPVLSATVPEIEATQTILTDLQGPAGKGCIVGIVDFGCDFAHKNFLKSNKTRLLKLWDQGSHGGHANVEYGSLYEAADIDTALAQTDPYNALGYRPDQASHGTHVMDIAAGNGGGSGVPGVAPESDIIFVQVDTSDVPWTGTQVVERSFGDSVHLLEALRFIFDEAKDRPCVVNVSLGTNGGPHDGTTLVEKGIDSLVLAKPGRAVVIAASNSYADQIHATGAIEVGATTSLGWQLQGSDFTENEMEIWYEGSGRIETELLDASGNSVGQVEPGESGTDTDANGIVTAFISSRLNDPNNHDNVIGIYVKGGAGVWKVNLKNSGTGPVTFHAWIERNDGAQSGFNPPFEDQITLGSISCGQESIVVGAYDAHRNNKPMPYYSSSGPTRDGRQKPEIAAPGHDVKAACSLTIKGVISKSGTSMAAPAVTGAVAVYLAEAYARGLSPAISQIRQAVTDSARTSPPAKAWDKRWGWGRISVKRMVDSLPSAGVTRATGAGIKGPKPPKLKKNISKKPAKKGAAKKGAATVPGKKGVQTPTSRKGSIPSKKSGKATAKNPSRRVVAKKRKR